MTEAQRERVVALYRSAQGPKRTLLVDEDEALASALTAGGVEVGRPQREIAGRLYEATDLWFGTTPRYYRMAVLARRALSKDLYRVLHLLERLVTGLVVIACPTDVIADHCYQEASEIFIAMHPEYQRVLHQASQVIELRRRS